MLYEIFSLLLGTAAQLLSLVFLARAYVQWAGASFRNPAGQFIMAATDWAVRPLRRFIPGLFGIDLASVVAAWIVHLIYLGILVTAFAGLTPDALFNMVWLAFLALARTFVHLLMGVVIISALLSWINPHAHVGALFDALARPLLAPVRRILPFLGGIDLSPLVVLLALQVVLIVLTNLQATVLFPVVLLP